MTASEAHENGIYCYVMTPFAKSGDVDLGALKDYVEAIIQSGVDGLTCIASTCEGAYLSEQERFDLVKAVCEIANGRVRVNVGAGAISTRESIRYAKHAEHCGATRLMIDMQTYFPVTMDEAYRHYMAIAESVTTIPIRLYNIPAPNKFDFTPERLVQMASISRITSIKEASGDVKRIGDIKALCGSRFAILCGFHYMVLDAFRLGAVGWEAGLHPLIARPCVDLYRSVAVERDLAKSERLFQRLLPLFTLFRYYGVPQALKAMSVWSDIKLGDPRPPLSPLPPAQSKLLEQILRDLELI
jgi:4-hydroxy-tetrahydrodipicolinate synthase